MSIEFMIPDARGSFLNLDEPSTFTDPKTGKTSGEPRWGATFLVPKDGETDKAIRKALLEVCTAKWGAKDGPKMLDAIMSQTNKTCYIDGKFKPKYEGYEGMMALTAYRKKKDGRPIVRDSDGTDVYDAAGNVLPGKGGRLYSGVFIRGKVEFFASTTGGDGLRAGLQVVQRIRKGDAFGGGAAPTADGFDAVEEGADADDMT